MKTSFRIVREIRAPTGLVFKAWTEASGLREWLCRSARTDPRQGGRFSLGWWSGYQAHGTYTAFDLPVKLGFTWLGEDEPGETEVRITFKPTDAGTQLTLTHSGFGTVKKWAGQAEGAAREWNRCLDNLRSVLELGIDPRETRLPRMGLEYETGKDGSGVVVLSVISGGPAEQAGLKKGDVLLDFDGEPVQREEDFFDAFVKHRAGQTVKITCKRDGKLRTATVVLGARIQTDVPDDPAALAALVAPAHNQTLAALRACISGLDEATVDRAPREGEWSVKQVLQHLAVAEQCFQGSVVDTILGQETAWIEARLPEQMAAIASTAPTADALLRRLEREMIESRTMVAALTPEHRVWRVRYRRIGQLLIDLAQHAQGHAHQVERTIAVVKR